MTSADTAVTRIVTATAVVHTAVAVAVTAVAAPAVMAVVTATAAARDRALRAAPHRVAPRRVALLRVVDRRRDAARGVAPRHAVTDRARDLAVDTNRHISRPQLRSDV